MRRKVVEDDFEDEQESDAENIMTRSLVDSDSDVNSSDKDESHTCGMRFAYNKWPGYDSC